MKLALVDEQFLQHLQKLADGRSYEERGLALFVITCLQKKSELARTFMRRVRVEDGSDGFLQAQREGRAVMKNLQDAVAVPDVIAESSEPEAPAPPAPIVKTAAPSTKPTTRKFLL